MSSPALCYRAGWHLRDKVEVLARLRWGQHGFANIRHANLSCPEQWQCRFSWRNKVSERWTGAWLHPLDYQDRSRVMVSVVLLLGCNALKNPDHTPGAQFCPGI